MTFFIRYFVFLLVDKQLEEKKEHKKWLLFRIIGLVARSTCNSMVGPEYVAWYQLNHTIIITIWNMRYNEQPTHRYRLNTEQKNGWLFYNWRNNISFSIVAFQIKSFTDVFKNKTSIDICPMLHSAQSLYIRLNYYIFNCFSLNILTNVINV